MSFPSEKPQGWQRAQRAKKGKFDCLYECGHLFHSRKEAMAMTAHEDCPVKLMNEKRFKKLLYFPTPVSKCQPDVDLNEQYKQLPRVKTMDLFFKKL